MTGERRSGRGSVALTGMVIQHYGPICHLAGPSCTRRATQKDHLVPFKLGGHDTLANLRPACATCNKSRGMRVLNGIGGRFTVIQGPPTSGKTTYVTEHAGPRDLVIDFDAIARALAPARAELGHEFPEYHRKIAGAARGTALRAMQRRLYPSDVAVWIIHAQPSPAELADYRMLRYDVVTLDPGRAVIEERAAERGSTRSAQFIDKWYAQHDDVRPATPSTTTTPTAGWW